jgi:flagellar basal body-associated protein FliL
MAGAAAFGGGKLTQVHVAHASEAKVEAKPPGPTMSLEPFLVSISDATHKPHAMKVTLAVEFESSTKEEALRTYVPRTRDACLSYLRMETFEQASEAETATKVRGELVAHLREAGVVGVERILITDFVVQ